MISAAGLLVSGSLVRAWQDVTFSTEVKVVNVLANVYGKNGEIVRGLTKDDFLLSEDGHPQTIRYFSRETDLPLTLGLLVDTSMSQRRVLDAERIASFRFVDQVLREATDHVFIVQFDMGVEIRQPLTSSRRTLESALAQVNTPSVHQLELQRGGGTSLYEAIAVAARDIMRAQTGRKALIVISDGVDTGSEIPLSTAVEEAQRAGTLVYSIVFSDANAYGTLLGPLMGGGADGKRVSCESPTRPADAALRCPRPKASSRSFRRFRRSFAASTTLASFPTCRCVFPGSADCNFPPRRKGW